MIYLDDKYLVVLFSSFTLDHEIKLPRYRGDEISLLNLSRETLHMKRCNKDSMIKFLTLH